MASKDAEKFAGIGSDGGDEWTETEHQGKAEGQRG